MATITKPKTLDEIESLAAKSSASILVLDKTNNLKKLQLIDDEGYINSSLIDDVIVTSKINLLSSFNEEIVKTIEILNNRISEMQSQIDKVSASQCELKTIIESLSTKIASTESTIKTSETTVTEESKPVEEVKTVKAKKTRKTTKKAEPAE